MNAIEILTINIEYIKGRFFKDDGTASDDELKMSLDAMKKALPILRQPKEQSEFTKNIKELIRADELTHIGAIKKLREACKLIDEAKAENKAGRELWTEVQSFLRLKLDEAKAQLAEQAAEIERLKKHHRESS